MKLIKNICKIIFNIIIYFLIILLFLYVCLVAYQKIFTKNDLLSFNDYYIFQIASSSMETDLHVGDYIIVEKTNDYEIGDIITFKDDGTYITHRIYKIEDEKIITKGDANDSIDESINKEDVLGKVLFKAIILSFVVKYKFIIIAFIISLFILEAVFKKDKNQKSNLKEKEE